jgi:hypothetical protein
MKYKLTDKVQQVNSIMLYRIEALKNFSDVKKGELGGWVEKEKNLSQENNCWVYDNTEVYDKAEVFGDAKVFGNAFIKYGQIKLKITTFKEKEYILSSLNVLPVNNKYYILYKTVNKDSDGIYHSCFDYSFIYKLNTIVEVTNVNTDIMIACGRGLHASIPNYWNEGNCILAVKVLIKDIICCQDGKIRCKALEVLEEINI